jgi:hypothetical protein
VKAVREFLEPALGAVSTNEYAEAENREGVALPSQVTAVQPFKVVGEAGAPTA